MKGGLSTENPNKYDITRFGNVTQLEKDTITKRTTADFKSTRRRGIQLRRKKGLNKIEKQKAILVASYYKENNLCIIDSMKLMGIKSKPNLYKYLTM